MNSQYLELRGRVDEKFNEIQARFSGEMKCASGCHSCCKPGLTVSEIEAEAIREALTPEVAEAARALAQANPHKGKRCAMLNAAGQCLIYEARPIVCRSHGVPLQVSVREDEKVRDVCPLNFTSTSLAEIPAQFVLNTDTVNLLLSLLNQRSFGKSQKRIPLTIDALLSPG